MTDIQTVVVRTVVDEYNSEAYRAAVDASEELVDDWDLSHSDSPSDTDLVFEVTEMLDVDIYVDDELYGVVEVNNASLVEAVQSIEDGTEDKYEYGLIRFYGDSDE